MRVLCFCGTYFQDDSKFATCPECGRIALLPNVSPKDLKQMEEELQIILRREDDQVS